MQWASRGWRASAALGVLVGVLDAGGAAAQATQQGVLEEVVVTAALRETSLQDTPIAVTAYTAETLQKNFVDSVDDLGVTTPNVTVAGRRSPLSAPFIIRGIGSNVVGFGLDDPVAQYVDGVYLGRPASSAFNFTDVERIEVLRGPQGTLRGRNSTAGAVLVTSSKPSTGGFSGEADGEYGSHDRHYLRASVNVPVNSRIALRGGFYYGDEDGRSTNTFLNRRTDRTGGEALRGSVLVRLTDRTELVVIGDTALYHQAFGFDAIPFSQIDESDRRGNPLTDDRYSNDTFSQSKVRTSGISATLNHDVTDDLVFTSITAGRRYRSYGVVDADGSTRDVIAALPASQGANNLDQSTSERQKQFSQELRLTYDGDGPLHLIGGLFFFTEKSKAAQNLGIRGVVPSSLVGVIPGLRFPDILRSYAGDFKNTAWAAYAQADYDVTDRLSASVGVRYSSEERRANAIQQVPAGYLSANPRAGVVNFRQEDVRLDYTDWSPSFGLNYKLNDDVLIYGKISKAFKSGGFNQTLAQDPFGPETLWAYEAGVKADLPEHGLRLNAASFYYRYKDLQSTLPGPVPNTTRIENAGSAENYGVELEAAWRPVEPLQIDATLGYLHARYEAFASTAGDLSGNRLPGAPKIQASFSAQYEVAVGDGASLTPRLQLKHEGYTYFTAENDRSLAHKPYTLVNAYLTLEAVDEAWFARLFLENLTGERFRTTAQRRDALTCFCRTGPGRVARLQLGVKF